MTLTTGSLLAERYRLGRRIAVGGMGEVWEAADTRLDRQVAVKVLKPELSGDGEFRHRFRAEARTTASLNNPGIAAVHDYGEVTVEGGPTASDTASASDTAYLVMELVAGESLAAILARQRRLPTEQTLDLLEQSGTALQAAHERGLVHRDIKPGNILVTPAGTVKLTDFGIARAVDAVPLTRTGMVMGTVHYIAPEQAAGGKAGPASDVYSLGVVGYECLAGRRPFLADSAVTVATMHVRAAPPPLPPDVPHAVRSLVEATMAKDPRHRYATGGELAAAVGAVRAGHPPPLPAGTDGTTAMLTGGYPATAAHPRTALLPPGAPTGPQTGHRTGPRTGGYPAAPERRSGSRAATRMLAGVVIALALVLGGWGLREALRPEATLPGVTDVPPAGGQPPPAAPQPPAEPALAPPAEQPAPAPPAEQPAEQPSPAQPDTVTVDETDYLGDRGADAAAELSELGLTPQVVDFDDSELDTSQQEECWVIDVEPSGEVETGETVTLTCMGAP